MDDVFATVQQWIPVDVLIGLTVASGIGFIGSLIAIPLILVRLPADYFDTRTPRHWMKDHHPVLRLSGLVVKNVVGVVFLLAGRKDPLVAPTGVRNIAESSVTFIENDRALGRLRPQHASPDRRVEGRAAAP